MRFETCIRVLRFLNFNENNNIVLINGSQLADNYALLHSPDEFALYEFDQQKLSEKKIITLVQAAYQDPYQITQVFIKDDDSLESTVQLVGRLSLGVIQKSGGYLFFTPADNQTSITRFVSLIAHLRAPDGCPWDRKQSLLTLRTNLLEEAHEVLEAIDHADMESLEEELGDLLLQIVLQAQIASEGKAFNLYNVINGIYQKIIFRHPHVFGDIEVKDVKGVLQNWEKWKAEERLNKNGLEISSILASVPRNLPSLALAQKYQERAARVGFDWPDIKPVIDKVEEEIVEIKNAADKASLERELGDLLFAIVNLIRWHGFDAESTLRQMNQRFYSRFNYIEEEVKRQGRQMTDLSLAELDLIWDKAKQAETIKVQSGQ